MEPKMFKFPSIEQSRQVLPEIIKNAQFSHVDHETHKPCYNESAPLPVVEFRGTVKLHGTNTAIVQTVSPTTGRTLHFQSRNRILTIDSDLMGFCAYMNGNTKTITPIFESIWSSLNSSGSESNQGENEIKAIAIFGEWCGIDIQKGVAISKLPRMFVIFAVEVVYEDTPAIWLDLSKLPEVKDEAARIFSIMQFPTYSLVIDFNQEESLTEGRRKMTELTMGVEGECPVGKYFGVSGTGEGIVWQAIPSPNPSVYLSSRYSDSRFWFKVKGEKHATNGKEKGPKPSANPETLSKMDAFIELVLTPDRLQQGLQVLERELLLPLEMKSVAAFIKWVKNDVMKEEYDRIAEAGLNEREISTAISGAAKKWYIRQLKA